MSGAPEVGDAHALPRRAAESEDELPRADVVECGHVGPSDVTHLRGDAKSLGRTSQSAAVTAPSSEERVQDGGEPDADQADGEQADGGAAPSMTPEDGVDELAPHAAWRRRRSPLLVLVLGALVVATVYERLAPREREVRVRLPSPSEIRRVEATWRDGDGDVVGSSRLEAEAGRPLRVETTLRLARGDSLGVSVVVEREDGSIERYEKRVPVADEGDVAVTLP